MKTFTLTYNATDWEATFKVDPSHKNYKVLKESLEFFYTSNDWESWLETYKEHGEYALFMVWALYYGKTIYRLAEDYSLYGIKEEFAELEGHIKLDGSYGVELIHVDDIEYNMHDFEVQENK